VVDLGNLVAVVALRTFATELMVIYIEFLLLEEVEEGPVHVVVVVGIQMENL
jgi:hypothetical protein